MFKRELRLYAFARDYLHKLSDDIPDQQLVVQAGGAGHTPLWILGHLTIVNDAGLGLLGQPKQCPKGWHRHFGPGSPTDGLALSPRPSKAELLAAFDATADAFAAAAPRVEEAWAEEEQPLDFLKPLIQTKGELVAHLLTTHIAGHIGQLSAWRRQMGYAHLF